MLKGVKLSSNKEKQMVLVFNTADSFMSTEKRKSCPFRNFHTSGAL